MAQVLQWTISNTWEDSTCDAVCRKVGRVCTEDCWPQDAADFERALKAHLDGVCYRVEDPSQEKSLSYKSWNPAKDPVTKSCYWDSNVGLTSTPRCSLKSETPDHLTEEGPIRRICPCAIHSGNASRVVQCRPTDTDVASAPISAGAKASAPISTEQESCSKLCVDGFGGAFDEANGEYIPEGGGLYGPYWEHALVLALHSFVDQMDFGVSLEQTLRENCTMKTSHSRARL